MARKPKKQGFDAQDLMKWLSTLSKAVTGDLNLGDVSGMDAASKAAPYASQAVQATNVKRKMDNEIAKGLADFFVPASEGVRLAQGKATPSDAVWAALGLAAYGSPVKKARQVYRGGKALRELGGGTKSTGPTTKQYVTNKDEADLVLWRLLLGE